MSVEDEIKALEVHRQHMKLQLEMIEKRIAGLQKAGKRSPQTFLTLTCIFLPAS